MPRALTPSLARIVAGRGDGRVVTRVDLLDHKDQNHLLTTSKFGSAPRVALVDLSIDTSEATDIAGTGSLKLLADDVTAEHVIPLVTRSPLSPVASTRVHVRFHAPGEDGEFCQYGVYEIKDADIDYTSAGVVIDAQIADNSRRVQRARFYRFQSLANKTPYPTAFRTLLQDVLPESEITIAPTPARTGLLTFDVQADRLTGIKEMATAIGFRIDWNDDGLGNTLIGPDIDAEEAENIQPVWTFVNGGNAKVVSIKRGLTDERSYNGVIAMGESTGSDKPPVRAEAWDTDPSSPTYFDPAKPQESPYGPVPFFYVSEFITTTAQARTAARARLPKVKGLVEVLQITCVTHPGVVPGDPILVEQTGIGVDGIYVVESVSLRRAGLMTIVCRDRRLFV